MKLDPARLWSAVQDCDTRMESYRALGRERVRKYVGNKYSDNGFPIPQPQNLIALQVNTLTNHCISANPRASMTARRRELWPEAVSFELAVNKRVERMNLGETIAENVMDAMLRGLGIVKIGGSNPLDGTGAFVETVDPDDFLIDVQSRHPQFWGNRYQLPVEFVRDSGMYDLREGQSVPVSNMDSMIGHTGQTRTSSIASGNGRYQASIFDVCDLIDLYLPYHGLLVTMLDGSGEIIRAEQWRGPDGGPFVRLGFIRVSGNILPLAPVALVEDLNDTINVVVNKVSQDAVDSKTVGAAPLSSAKDTQQIINAKNGEIVNVATAQNIAMMKFNGPDNALVGLSTLWRNHFMELAGSLQVIGGLGPQADTLGQEELLTQTASKLVDVMQQKVVEFTAAIMRQIAWYRWHDDQSSDIVTKTVGMTEVVETFGPSRNGEWSDYDIQIDPYSMRRKTPMQQMALVDRFVGTVLIPNQQQMAGQGVALNWFEYTETWKRLNDCPVLGNILFYSEANQMALDSQPIQAPNPNKPNGEYTRINRPGATQQQQDEALVAMMSGDGGGMQPRQMATAARMAG